jgi:hypothetical protein
MPERSCETCLHFLPYEGRLRMTFGKCGSPDRPKEVNFAETCRGDDRLCGPTARWWARKPPRFELVEESPRLDWEDEEEPEEP